MDEDDVRRQVPITDQALAEKLHAVRARADQYGEVFTKLPGERYADARFDDRVPSPAIPNLRRDGFCNGVEGGSVSHAYSATSFSSMFYTPKSNVADDIKRSFAPRSSTSGESSSTVHHSPLPPRLCDYIPSCRRCSATGSAPLRPLYPSEVSSSIIQQTCSECACAVVYPGGEGVTIPVGHECVSCSWRVCLGCSIGHYMKQQIELSKSTLSVEMELEYTTKLKLVEQENEALREEIAMESVRQISPDGTPVSTHSPSTAHIEMIQSLKDRIVELETKLLNEKNARSQASALLGTLQKEHMQYKTDIEMNLESGAAEQVLLQSRLIEQSVLLADARARIDELTSTQRRTPDPELSSGSGISQREALLLNENNHLKEEIDSLKLSLHVDFDNWKRTVLRQVKNECIRYRERLQKSSITDDAEDNSTVNQKELDFIFDEVDWTGDIDSFSRASPACPTTPR
jgi:hypothetical protein